jgi:hypothetical protein
MNMGTPEVTIAVTGEKIAEVVDSEELNTILAPIRPGLEQRYFIKARKAMDAGLYDAAFNYFWDLTINDLRQKVEKYGIEIFIAVGDKVKYHPRGSTLQDRWKDVTDSKLLEGCSNLEILSRTAYRHLVFMLQVRNHESAAHPVNVEAELDRETALFLMRDAVKFVLAHENPEPGFNIRDLADNLKKQDFSTVEIEAINQKIQGLNTQQADTAQGMIIALYLEEDESVRKNIESIIEALWSISSDEAKTKLANKFDRSLAEANIEERDLIFRLLVKVVGIRFLHSNTRKLLFEAASSKLIEVHFETDNYYKEPAPARQLADLGVCCPDEALGKFSAAFLLCYNGNRWGVSEAAQMYLARLKKGFSNKHFKALIVAVRSNPKVQSELLADIPFARLQSLFEEIKDSLTTAADKQFCEFVIESTKEAFLATLEE